MTDMFQIHWRSVTDATGHGSSMFPEAQAKQIVKELNREYGYITHWYQLSEPEQDDRNGPTVVEGGTNDEP